MCGQATGHAMPDWATSVLGGPEPPEPDQLLRLNQTFNGRWQLTGTFNTEPDPRRRPRDTGVIGARLRL